MKAGGSPQAGSVPVPKPPLFLLPLFQRAQRPWVTLACPCPCCPRPHPPAQHHGRAGVIVTCPFVWGGHLLALLRMAGGRWPGDGGPTLWQWQSPGHCQLLRKWGLSWSPKAIFGLVLCHLGANSVLRGATKPGSQGCAVTHIPQSWLWCPYPSLMATLGGVGKPPALPSDGGTRMASLGWWHQDLSCWEGFAGIVALGPAMLGWHQDSLTRTVAPGLAVPSWR